jgi:hypothetical protein
VLVQKLIRLLEWWFIVTEESWVSAAERRPTWVRVGWRGCFGSLWAYNFFKFPRVEVDLLSRFFADCIIYIIFVY